MEEDIKSRLLAYLAHIKVGQTKFEESSGLSRGYINKLTDGVGVNKILKIHRMCPGLNLSWLITGEGDMLLSEKVNESPSDRYLRIIEKQQNTIDELVAEIRSKKADARQEDNARCADVSGSDLAE